MKVISDFFDGTCHQKPPRKKPRVMAHVTDAGVDAILFECKKCGWNSSWLINDISISDAKRGIPCERCNEVSTDETK